MVIVFLMTFSHCEPVANVKRNYFCKITSSHHFFFDVAVDYFDKNFVKTTNLCTTNFGSRSFISRVSQFPWKNIVKSTEIVSRNHTESFSRKFSFFYIAVLAVLWTVLRGKKEKTLNQPIFRQINYQVMSFVNTMLLSRNFSTQKNQQQLTEFL